MCFSGILKIYFILTDLLDKAKRKILKKEIGDDSSDEFSYQPRSDFVMVYHQEVGK